MIFNGLFEVCVIYWLGSDYYTLEFLTDELSTLKIKLAEKIPHKADVRYLCIMAHKEEDCKDEI